ncbi:GNAT family N-acetyltransferase [Streptomyces sp. NPDC046821]|uniref:GNAT family N-acetyltransferase n=1 Tax=Streptomyces sp. NPDC046821 TaxID=3154702 RepID=UPI0033DE253F
MTGMTEIPETRGHGLHLRAWRVGDEGDADAVLKGLTDPEFRRWNTPLTPVDDLAGARRYLLKRSRLTESGDAVACAVADDSTGEVLGSIGLSVINPVFRTAIVGYWVLPEARGCGVATRALSLVSRLGFGELGLYRIELGHAVGHEVSCRVAERGGYGHEGTLRGAMFEAGTQDAFRDVHLHARLATDPEPDVV